MSVGKSAWTPMKISVGWMLGTFFAYLLFGDTEGLDYLPSLAVFIGLATGAWGLGYRWGVNSFPMQWLRERYGDPAANERRQRDSARRWVWASGLYFIVYSYSLLVLYGATPATFLDVIKDPGSAYAAKFEVIEGLTTQTGNTLLQVLILLSLFQLALGPLVGYFWTQLPTAAKLVATLGIVSYVAFFLYIGTMQGLGFLLIGLIAGLLARQHRQTVDVLAAVKRKRRRWTSVVIALGLVAFSLYMINAQSDRLNTFDVNNRFEPNPYLEAATSRDFARGVAVVVHYPTHGYRGLAFNLETPFTWTAGRGSSRAVDSYWEQYVGGGSVFNDTRPAQTEKRTGWSATVSWSTVYPWLASDLTFPGTLLLMIFIGRWTARMWLRSIAFHDPLTLMLFSQLALFVAFVSVNNQVLISRPALIAVVSCVGLHLARELHATLRAVRRPWSEFGREVEVAVSGVDVERPTRR